MTTQQAMSLIYPTLCAVLAAKVGVLIFYWYTSRGRMVASAVVVWVIELFIVFLLTLGTGSNPPFDLDQYRFMVVVFRFMMLVAVGWSVWENVISIRYMIGHKDLSSS